MIKILKTCRNANWWRFKKVTTFFLLKTKKMKPKLLTVREAVTKIKAGLYADLYFVAPVL